MGLFDNFFAKQIKSQLARGTVGSYSAFTAYQPRFTSWSGCIYENQLISAAIEAGARHASKLRVEFVGSAKPAMRARMKVGPNAWQTWPKFLARLWTIREVNNTGFVIPQLNEFGEVEGIFPVLATGVEMVEANKKPYLKYSFANGKTGVMEYEACAVMPKHQYHDDFFGDPQDALKSTLQLIEMQNQGIQEAIKSSAAIRFMARLSNFGKSKDAAKMARDFTDEMLKGEGGGAVMLYPTQWDNMQQIKATPYTLDAEQTKQIKDNVCDYFGVNEKILQNSATGDELDAFFEGCLEPFAIMLSDELTRMLFTPREIAQGNRVIVTANRLQYMSTSNKISLAKEMGDRGVLKENEIRELFNYEPLLEGGDHRPIRGEYYFADVGKNDDINGGENNAE